MQPYCENTLKGRESACGIIFPKGDGKYLNSNRPSTLGAYYLALMRVVIQRVSEASVRVAGNKVAEIGVGMLVLLGVAHSDTEADAIWLARKTASLRIFGDEAGQMNRSPIQAHAGLLVVSQFTLLADCRRGNRPSFIDAARPEQAFLLYEFFCSQIESLLGRPVQRGIFGADMKVSLLNDGPVTIVMDSTAQKGAA